MLANFAFKGEVKINIEVTNYAFWYVSILKRTAVTTNAGDLYVNSTYTRAFKHEQTKSYTQTYNYRPPQPHFNLVPYLAGQTVEKALVMESVTTYPT